MSDRFFKVDDNSIFNPYREFDIDIADGESATYFYNFSTMRILSLSATVGVKLTIGGGGGTESDIVGAGIGFDLPEGVYTDRLIIFNNSGGTLTGKIALGVGKITDNRLTVSGEVSVTNKPDTLTTTADATASTTPAVLLAANTNRYEAIIQNFDNSINLRVGESSSISATRGIKILPQQTLILNTTDTLYICSESGTPSYGVSQTEY